MRTRQYPGRIRWAWTSAYRSRSLHRERALVCAAPAVQADSRPAFSETTYLALGGSRPWLRPTVAVSQSRNGRAARLAGSGVNTLRQLVCGDEMRGIEPPSGPLVHFSYEALADRPRLRQGGGRFRLGAGRLGPPTPADPRERKSASRTARCGGVRRAVGPRWGERMPRRQGPGAGPGHGGDQVGFLLTVTTTRAAWGRNSSLLADACDLVAG